MKPGIIWASPSLKIGTDLSATTVGAGWATTGGAIWEKQRLGLTRQMIESRAVKEFFMGLSVRLEAGG